MQTVEGLKMGDNVCVAKPGILYWSQHYIGSALELIYNFTGVWFAFVQILDIYTTVLVALQPELS